MYVTRLRKFGDILLAHKTHKGSVVENPPLYMLHGVLGNKRNFQTPAKAIAEACQCEVICLDARNHGQSPHMPTMSYFEMAEDIERFAKKTGHSELNILGHSMGGRTAMVTALSDLPAIHVNKLIVVDVSADNSRSSNISNTVSSYIKEMARIDMSELDGLQSTEARERIREQLSKHVKDPGVMAFLLTNLDAKRGTYKWRSNIHALSSQIERISNFPEFKNTFDRPTQFIRGSESAYLQERHFKEIYRLFPKAKIDTVQGSGHWVHADNPKIFTNLVIDFLSEN